MKKMRTLKDAGDLKGKKVLARFDFNVPIEDGKVRDDYRIRKSLATLDYLVKAGARTVIIAHIESEAATLRPVYDYFIENLPQYGLKWCDHILEEGKCDIDALAEGGVMLSENIRLYDGEKKNDKDFAKKLAAFADVYVNDAFSVSHRKHASVVGVPQYIKGYAGFQLEEEMKELSTCFSPEHPFLFILGGAKFDTKLPLIEKFIPIADSIFVAGALAHNFYTEAGATIGASLVSQGFFGTKKLVESNKIHLPKDVLITGPKGDRQGLSDKLAADERIADAGKETLAIIERLVRASHFILWNGPLGSYEEGFKKPTLDLAQVIAEHSRTTGARSVVGGGDTLAAIAELGLEGDFGFVSTGGGAMLDFLGNGSLPGIDALM